MYLEKGKTTANCDVARNNEARDQDYEGDEPSRSMSTTPDPQGSMIMPDVMELRHFNHDGTTHGSERVACLLKVIDDVLSIINDDTDLGSDHRDPPTAPRRPRE